MPCENGHLNISTWTTNTGDLCDVSKRGQRLVIQTPDGPILRLRLCRDCGATFSAIPTKRQTAATLRILKRKVKK